MFTKCTEALNRFFFSCKWSFLSSRIAAEGRVSSSDQTCAEVRYGHPNPRMFSADVLLLLLGVQGVLQECHFKSAETNPRVSAGKQKSPMKTLKPKQQQKNLELKKDNVQKGYFTVLNHTNLKESVKLKLEMDKMFICIFVQPTNQ